MELNDQLAALNATLNGLSGLCVLAGWRWGRAGRRDAHKRAMVLALSLSAAFLVSYLTRISIGGTHQFPAEHVLRPVYLGVLGSHVILAAAVPFMAIRAVWLAVKDRIPAHRRLVRVATPIWLYVSVTGVLVYVMLYHIAGVS